MRDLDASLAFYGAFGFEEVNRTTFDEGRATIVHVKLDEYVLELFGYELNRDAAPLEFGFGNDLGQIGVKHISLATADIEAALVEARRLGIADAHVEIGGLEARRARWFFVKDPDGMWVEVIQEDRFMLYSHPWPER